MNPPTAYNRNPQQPGPNAQQVWDQSWWDQSGIDTTGNPYAHNAGTPQLGPWSQNQANSWLAQMNQGNMSWRNPGGSAIGQNPGGNTGGGTTGGASVTTSIKPRDIFTPQMTQQRVNQSTADAMQRGNLTHLLKGFDTAGVSRSGRNTARAMPGVAAAYGEAAQSQAAIPLADQAANQQNRMRGEIAQGLEFGQLARLLLGEQALGNWVQQQNMGNIGDILSTVMRVI